MYPIMERWWVETYHLHQNISKFVDFENKQETYHVSIYKMKLNSKNKQWTFFLVENRLLQLFVRRVLNHGLCWKNNERVQAI